MGMFDYLTCEAEVPGLGVPRGVTFQTKDLFRTFARLTIDRAGRLVERAARAGAGDVPPPDRDLEFHGDVMFCGDTQDGEFVRYVARFTDGRLAWIRRLADLPERQQVLLSCRE